MTGQRLVDGGVLDVVLLGAADGVFLLLECQSLPLSHGMLIALHMQVTPPGKLPLRHQSHLGSVFTLGILGTIDKSRQIAKIEEAESALLLTQLHLARQPRHQALSGQVQHIDAIAPQLEEEIKGGLRHLALTHPQSREGRQ